MVPDGIMSGGAGKGNHNPAIHADEKSDAPIIPKKPPNKGQSSAFAGAGSAEAVEGRGVQPRETPTSYTHAGHRAGKVR